MLRAYRADLHVHTCLSPCTEQDMSSKTILAAAKEKRIAIIGICDHNSTENSQAVINAAREGNIHVLPGLEVATQEEVHVLALFDRLANALKLQEYIYENLPGENDEEAFGLQIVVNEKEEVLGFNRRLLIGATTIPLEVIIQSIHAFDGIAIASHIDRESFGLIGQLGFIPEDIELDALEISPSLTIQEAKQRFGHSYPITCSSDAHHPDEVGKGYTDFLIEECTVSEIKKALRNEEGRKLVH